MTGPELAEFARDTVLGHLRAKGLKPEHCATPFPSVFVLAEGSDFYARNRQYRVELEWGAAGGRFFRESATFDPREFREGLLVQIRVECAARVLVYRIGLEVGPVPVDSDEVPKPPRCCARGCDLLATSEEHVGVSPEGDERPVGLVFCEEHEARWEEQDPDTGEGLIPVDGYQLPWATVRGYGWDHEAEAQWLADEKSNAAAFEFLRCELGDVEAAEFMEAWFEWKPPEGEGSPA